MKNHTKLFNLFGKFHLQVVYLFGKVRHRLRKPATNPEHAMSHAERIAIQAAAAAAGDIAPQFDFSTVAAPASLA